MKKKLDLVSQIAKDLLNKMGFVSVAISSSQGEEDVIQLQIESTPEETGLLIGFHGETISAFQLIISQITHNQLGEWQKISVNVGDYREKRKEALEAMAFNAAQRVKNTQQSVALPYLNSGERRLVHLILSEDSDIETLSEGEGRQRRLIINLKNPEEKTD